MAYLFPKSIPRPGTDSGGVARGPLPPLKFFVVMLIVLVTVCKFNHYNITSEVTHTSLLFYFYCKCASDINPIFTLNHKNLYN